MTSLFFHSQNFGRDGSDLLVLGFFAICLMIVALQILPLLKERNRKRSIQEVLEAAEMKHALRHGQFITEKKPDEIPDDIILPHTDLPGDRPSSRTH